MTETSNTTDKPDAPEVGIGELIDMIGRLVPPELKTAYYRAMCHLRDLPEDDEILRLVFAMGILTFLIRDAPLQIARERELFERTSRAFVATAERLEATGGEYFRTLDQRLKRLPEDIAKGISPEAIVNRVNDSLKRQFDQSTIPAVAKELAATAETIKAATKEYRDTTAEVNDAWRSAAAKARQTIGDIRPSIDSAAEGARQAARELSTSFRKSYRWALATVCVLGFVAGIALCMAVYEHLRPYKKTVYEIPPELQLMMERRARESQPQRGR
jgi:uncharacterized protein YukE